MIPVIIDNMNNTGFIGAGGGGGDSYITLNGNGNTLTNVITGTLPIPMLSIGEHWCYQSWLLRATESDNEAVLDALENLFAVMRLAHGEESLNWSR
jgi:hypothetical protein